MTFKEKLDAVSDIGFAIGVLKGVEQSGLNPNAEAALRDAQARLAATSQTIARAN